MKATGAAFGALPPGLRDPLIAEHDALIQAYLERRWTPAGVSGGKFCEIVYTILDGSGTGTYSSKPTKPKDMVAACKALEQRMDLPRSFRILIPRMLPPLYEVRNNRGAGHAGGEVDPNHMDTVVVLAMVNWVMAELVRVLHSTTTEEAQSVVDSLASRRTPLIWQGAERRRVLDTSLSLVDEALVLIGTAGQAVKAEDVFRDTGAANRTYFTKLLRKLHKERLIELEAKESTVTMLPPGTARVEAIVKAAMSDEGRASGGKKVKPKPAKRRVRPR